MKEQRMNDKPDTRRYILPVAAFIGLLVLLVGLALPGAPAQAGNSPARSGSDGSQPDDITYPIREGFENGDTGAFYSQIATCVPGGCGWSAVTNQKHSGNYSAFAPDVNNVSDQRLVLITSAYIPAGTTVATLTFWHRYNFETSGTNYYDGGVLEVSTDGGSTWSDSTVQFLSGGYNSTIHTGGNPLAGRPAWGGSTGGVFTEVQANLLAYANHSVSIRLREGTDASNGAGGWWVDDIQLTLSTPGSCSPPAWDLVSTYPVTSGAPAAVALNGKLYMFGGIDSTGSVLTAAYRYDPGHDSWTAIAPLPGGRVGAAAVTDGTNIYVLGGNDPSFTSTGTMWRYDPVADAYTPLAPYSTGTWLHAAALLNGKIYRIGGLNSNTSVGSVEVYTIATNTWAGTTSYPSVEDALTAITMGNYIYTAGGHNNNNGQDSNKTYRFDPVTSTWDDAAIADLPHQWQSGGSAMLNGRWVLAAGFYNSTENKAIAWDPATDTWSSLPDLLQGYYWSGVGAIGEALYVVAGQDLNNHRAVTNQRYTEVPCVPFTPTPTIIPTQCPIQFSDVPQGSTFYANIRCLACRGIINGYPDGTFKPNNNVTRGQLSKIVSNAVGYNDAEPNQTFEDVPLGSTFQVYIGRLASRGFINGYACGGLGEPCGPGNLPYFRPNSNATRGQISKIVSNTAGFSDPQPGQLFQDVPLGSAFQVYIGRLASRGYMSGYPCGGAGEPCGPGNLPYFRPNSNATRGQTSKIVGNTFFPNCQTPSFAK